MRKYKGAEIPAAAAGGNGEKIKLIAMSVALLLVIGAYAFNQLRRDGLDEAAEADLPVVGEATIEVPAPPPGLFEGVSDATDEERVLIEHDELEVLLAHVRSLTPTHYETADTQRMDAAAVAAIRADPAAHRGDFYSVRGEVLDLRERVAPSGTKHWAALLRTSEGDVVHVRSPRLVDRDLAAGQWARLDGLFFKLLSDQDKDGAWVTGPMVVGSRIVRSYEDFGQVAQIERELLLGIADDGLDAPGSFPDLVRWRVLAWMRDMPADAIDWEQAPELNGELMDRIVENGDEYRGQAFVLPASRVQSMSRKAAGENPARLDYVYESWIGNSTWTRHSPMLFTISSAGTDELAMKDLVEGQLVFIKNMAYDTVDNVRRLVPVFAARELRTFNPGNDITLRVFGAAFLGFLVLMTLTIAILWQRSQARSKALQLKLIERRRARRAATVEA
ncbi:hypothetical protein [Engelhardtia mirabilis]|uniref:Uncharacterized protein n=1 Tax=Engelhardtia mirabilis TaxID=2528011 RepID=A0A518BSJ7_9BACT|nr:hypothetical protein Pla133_50610 [Planctomycetes bacterium Pla133]QDV04263.1 hypothetical protein Pla86_50580 [Planctomycetes bacterium Pla86]